jgi:hypothetical protein
MSLKFLQHYPILAARTAILSFLALLLWVSCTVDLPVISTRNRPTYQITVKKEVAVNKHPKIVNKLYERVERLQRESDSQITANYLLPQLFCLVRLKPYPHMDHMGLQELF